MNRHEMRQLTCLELSRRRQPNLLRLIAKKSLFLGSWHGVETGRLLALRAAKSTIFIDSRWFLSDELDMNWKHLFHLGKQRGQRAIEEIISDVALLIDGTQLNRRTRLAWQQGRSTKACYLLLDHQRRRITRRREIRRLIEG